MISWWQVLPVNVTGESELTQLKNKYSRKEKINKAYYLSNLIILSVQDNHMAHFQEHFLLELNMIVASFCYLYQQLFEKVERHI
jgi:hypothetical protein